MREDPTLPHTTADNVALIGLCLLAAGICSLVFAYISNDILDQLPAWQAIHMAGQSAAPMQYRWLSFFVPELLSRLGMDLRDAYLLLRFAGLALGFWFTGLITRDLVRWREAPSVIVLTLAVFYVTTTRPHMQPAEEPNLFAFALFIWMVIRNWGIGWLTLVLGVGILNKDTVGFLIPFLFLYRWATRQGAWITLRDSAILSVVFIAGYAGLRWAYGVDRAYLGGLWQADYNLRFLLDRPVIGSFWLLPSLLPAALLMFRWKLVPLVVRCFLPSMLLFVLGHWLISRTDEFRTYTPLAILMWPGVLAAFTEKGTSPTPPVSTMAEPS